METKISPHDLAEGLDDILSRVRDGGERFVVELDGGTLAVIAAMVQQPGLTWGEFLATYHTNWPRPDDQFADDLEAIRASQPPVPEPSAWPD